MQWVQQHSGGQGCCVQLPKLNQEGNLQFNPEREQDCVWALETCAGMLQHCAENK